MKVTGLLFSFRRFVCGERHAFFTIYIIAWNHENVTGMLFLRGMRVPLCVCVGIGLLTNDVVRERIVVRVVMRVSKL